MQDAYLIMENNLLGTTSLRSLFVRFVIPSVLSMVLAGIQGMIDGLFLGRYAGSNAMASVNIAIPYMQLIIGCSMIICTGTLSYLGRTLGENPKSEYGKNIFRTALVSIMVSSIVILLLGVFAAEKLAVLMGANAVLANDISMYIKVVGCFAPIMAIMFLCGFTNRLLGKPQLYLYATIAGVLGNIIMDYIAVKLLGLATIGAALATGISYTIGLLIVIGPVLKRKSTVNIYEGNFKLNILKKIAWNGSSEGVTSISTAVVALIFNMTFIAYAGEDGVAAFTIINYIGNFVVLIMFGVADGIGVIISYNYGAKLFDRVSKVLRMSILLNFISGLIVFIIFNLFAEELIKLFIVSKEDIVKMAVEGAHIYSFAFLLNGFNIVQSAYQTALGNAFNSALVAAGRGLIFIFVWIFILPKILGLTGVWMTVPCAEMATLFIAILLHKIAYREMLS